MRRMIRFLRQVTINWSYGRYRTGTVRRDEKRVRRIRNWKFRQNSALFLAEVSANSEKNVAFKQFMSSLFFFFSRIAILVICIMKINTHIIYVCYLWLVGTVLVPVPWTNLSFPYCHTVC